MATKTMEHERIIMNFSVAPSAEDIEVMALNAIESLPEQLMELCEGLAVKVEDFPDDATGSKDSLQAMVERYAALATSTRAAIDSTASLGDIDTSDLFTAVSRDIDKSLWFLEAHLQ